MRPASIFDRSSTSLISDSRCWPLSRMSRAYSAYFGWPSGPKICFSSTSRSEEPTSELQSLMRISYAVFCLKKKTLHIREKNDNHNVSNLIKTTHLDTLSQHYKQIHTI